MSILVHHSTLFFLFTLSVSRFAVVLSFDPLPVTVETCIIVSLLQMSIFHHSSLIFFSLLSQFLRLCRYYALIHGLSLEKPVLLPFLPYVHLGASFLHNCLVYPHSFLIHGDIMLHFIACHCRSLYHCLLYFKCPSRCIVPPWLSLAQFLG